MDTVVHNKIIRGNFGKCWLDGELLSEVKSFEAKLTLVYEEVNIQGEAGTYQRLVGFTIAGTVVLHKIDNKIQAKVATGAKTLQIPDIKIVTALDDPDSNGAERVELLGVTLDEVALTQYENKKIGEVSVPFKAADYNFLDMII